MAGAAEGIGVAGGELPGAVQEVLDDQELLVGVDSEHGAGLADEVAEHFLVARGGGLGGLHDLAAAVAGVGAAADVAGPLEAVEDGGDSAGGKSELAGQI